MVAALGVRRNRLFTLVFMLGSFLAGLGGALQVPHAPIHHAMDLQVIVEVFVVVVVGGLGSVAGAWLAAVLIGTLNAFGLVVLPEASLVVPFLVMAAVLIVRPWGLLGRPQPLAASATGSRSGRSAPCPPASATPPSASASSLWCCRRWWAATGYRW